MLSFDNFNSDSIPIENSIGQGETASMILYLIYSHGLINILQGTNEDEGAYVDDTFMAIADTFDGCNDMLNGMLDKQCTWFSVHNSKAELSKFQCIHLMQCKDLQRADFMYRKVCQPIACVTSACLLDMHIDQELG